MKNNYHIVINKNQIVNDIYNIIFQKVDFEVWQSSPQKLLRVCDN